MEQQITDKTHLIILTNDIRIWITEKEFELFKGLISAGKSFVEIAGNIINTNTILFVGPRINIETADRIKRGEWQCSICKRWHPRFEECGCQGGKY